MSAESSIALLRQYWPVSIRAVELMFLEDEKTTQVETLISVAEDLRRAGHRDAEALVLERVKRQLAGMQERITEMRAVVKGTS